jgi:hypothetical protein
VAVRGRDDLDEHVVKPTALAAVEPGCRPPGVKAGVPEDLVGELVADPGDPALVHEERLELAARGVEDLLELVAADAGGVGTERPGDVLQAGAGLKQPDAAEHPHVAVAELAALEDQGQAVVTMCRVLAVATEAQEAGHPEVERERWAAGGREHPLPVAGGRHEAAAGERGAEGLRRRVADDGRRGYGDLEDPAPGGVARVVALETLDVGKLGDGIMVAVTGRRR